MFQLERDEFTFHLSNWNDLILHFHTLKISLSLCRADSTTTAAMETNGDINFLLSILHGVTITESSADRVIKRWRMYCLSSLSPDFTKVLRGRFAYDV